MFTNRTNKYISEYTEIKKDWYYSVKHLASHAGVFRGARISPLKTSAWEAIKYHWIQITF